MKKVYLNLRLIMGATVFMFAVLSASFSAHAQSSTSYGVDAGNGGTGNSSFGNKAGDVVTGYVNSFFGYYAGSKTSSGNANAFFGGYSGYDNINGNENSFYGHSSGFNNTSGQDNTYLGYYAGYLASTSSYNTYIGSQAGRNSTGSSNIFIGHRAGFNETGSNKLYIENSDATTPLIYGDFSSNAVGINTKAVSGYTLSVNGKIRATEVRVYTGWADYVFEEDYKLNTLEEVERFIKINGHLPDVPDAGKVEADGILIGEMNATLLRKIEELTLYTIAQEKQIQAQEEQVEQQNEINEKLLAKLDELQKKVDALSEKQ